MMIMTVVLAAAAASPGVIRLLAVAAAGAGGAWLLWRGGRSWRSTTLAAPCHWALGAYLALTAVEAAACCTSAGMVHARYLAAVGTLAPWVALLGAKRPQDRAWQWIVFSLLIVLWLPCGKALLFGTGSPSPHTSWQWFLALLIAAGCANHLPTRYGLAGVLLTAGQVLLLADDLPAAPGASIPDRPLWALLSIAAAIVLASALAARPRCHVQPIDRVWVDFRDAFGAVWALRVAERFNASAARYGWHVHLGWSGLRPSNRSAAAGASADNAAGDDADAMQQALKSLLWRFVTPEWIADRLPARPPDER